MAFAGFLKDSFEFLSELEGKNSKEWFEANRKRYEAIWKGTALDYALAHQ